MRGGVDFLLLLLSMSHIVRVRGLARNVLFGGAFHRFDVWFHQPNGKNAWLRPDPRRWSNVAESMDAGATGSTGWNDTVTVTADDSSKEETWLVVGDGDFSFSVQLAQELSQSNGRSIRLVASVLESEERHARVYRDSSENVQKLRSFRNTAVRFEIDATRLQWTFPAHSIHRIQFNFPHWPGKSNHRYNMQLLRDVFASCRHVLTHSGTLHMALCHGQGGAEAGSLAEWKASWRVPALAAAHGYLLRRTEPLVVRYNVSSHRGVDRAFPVGVQPLLYVFTAGPMDTKEPTPPVHCQMAHRFELRLMLPPRVLSQLGEDMEHVASQGRELLERSIVPEIVPPGIRCELPLHNLVPGDDVDSNDTMAPPERRRKYPLLVLLVVLVGERRALSRADANALRSQLEDAVDAHLGGDEVILHKGDRQVSQAFPYHLLGALIQERGHEDAAAEVPAAVVRSVGTFHGAHGITSQ
jgi:Domain of unknown function (DUF2431)